MSMFGPKMGDWFLWSKTDPRWDCQGRAAGLICEGGPPELKAKVEELTGLYGPPPNDLEWSFWKD